MSYFSRVDRRRRVLTIAAALVAATLLAIAVQGGRWWQVGDITIGPISSYRCFSGDCAVVGVDWVGAGEGWARAGLATYVAGLVAAGLLVIGSALLASKRLIKVVAKSGLVAVVTGLVSGAIFIAKFPDLPEVSIARGTWCYAAGLAIAIGAHVSVLRAKPLT